MDATLFPDGITGNFNPVISISLRLKTNMTFYDLSILVEEAFLNIGSTRGLIVKLL